VAWQHPVVRARVVTSTVEESIARIELRGGPLAVRIRRTPRARGLRITIHPVHGPVVSLPPATRRGWGRADADIEAFLRAREPWLRRHLDRDAAARAARLARPALDAGRVVPYLGRPHRVAVVTRPGLRRSRVLRVGADVDVLLVERPPADRRSVGRALETWLRERATEAVNDAVRRHAPALGVAPATVVIRDPRSRWGSCTRDARLMLSWRLVLAPPEILESVVVHELCHLRWFGHGPRFRALLAGRLPDHAERRRWLHVHGADLHHALDEEPARDAAGAA